VKHCLEAAKRYIASNGQMPKIKVFVLEWGTSPSDMLDSRYVIGITSILQQ
jgi:hypothetical protein